MPRMSQQSVLHLVCAAVCITTVSCGSDSDGAPDITGMYQITRQTESLRSGPDMPATCGSEGPVVTTGAYLKLGLDDFNGHLTWARCEDAAGAQCDEEFWTFSDLNGGWEIGAATSAAFSGGLCTLFHLEGSVTSTSNGVRLVLKEWNEFPTATAAECTLDRADALAAQDDCDRHVVIEANSLGG